MITKNKTEDQASNVSKKEKKQFLLHQAYQNLSDCIVHLTMILNYPKGLDLNKKEEDYVVVMRDHLQDMAADMRRNQMV